MLSIPSNSRVFVAGKTGSGKTVFVKKALFPMFQRKVFWDIKIENSDLIKTCDCILCTTPIKLVQLLNANYRSILYQPDDTSERDFDEVCKVIFYFGNMTLFIDEVSSGEICTPSIIQKWHKEIMIRGRSRGVGIVNVTQRPRSIHNTLISESEYFIIFRLQLDTDVGKLRTIMPGDYCDMIHTLPYYHSIYTDNSGEIKMLKPIPLS